MKRYFSALTLFFVLALTLCAAVPPALQHNWATTNSPVVVTNISASIADGEILKSNLLSGAQVTNAVIQVGATNFVAIQNGAANNLTVTNTLTLVNTNLIRVVSILAPVNIGFFSTYLPDSSRTNYVAGDYNSFYNATGSNWFFTLPIGFFGGGAGQNVWTTNTPAIPPNGSAWLVYSNGLPYVTAGNVTNYAIFTTAGATTVLSADVNSNLDVSAGIVVGGGVPTLGYITASGGGEGNGTYVTNGVNNFGGAVNYPVYSNTSNTNYAIGYIFDSGGWFMYRFSDVSFIYNTVTDPGSNVVNGTVSPTQQASGDGALPAPNFTFNLFQPVGGTGSLIISRANSYPGVNGDTNANELYFNTSGNFNGNLNAKSYTVNGVPFGQVAGVTNTASASTNSTTFDPAVTAYFTTCDATSITNGNAYTVTQFSYPNAVYYNFNPLPAGAKFLVTFEIPVGSSIYTLPDNPASYLFSGASVPPPFYFQYTLYTPNPNASATVSLSTPLQNLTALANLTANLKSSGLWVHATNYLIYPFAGGNVTCDENNLVGKSTYNATFHDGLLNAPAHNAYGVSNPPVSGWADTHFIPTATQTTNLTIVVFASTFGPTNFMVSSYDGTNKIFLHATVDASTNFFSTINTTNSGTNAFGVQNGGDFFAITRNSANNEFGLIDTNYFARTAVTNGLSISNLVLFAKSAAANESTNLTIGFVGVFDALTTNQLATLQNIVLQYESDMGRLPGGSQSSATLPPVTPYLIGGAGGSQDASLQTNLQNFVWGTTTNENSGNLPLKIKYFYTNGVPLYGIFFTN